MTPYLGSTGPNLSLFGISRDGETLEKNKDIEKLENIVLASKSVHLGKGIVRESVKDKEDQTLACQEP